MVIDYILEVMHYLNFNKRIVILGYVQYNEFS
jgi:hypothetical protein